MKKLLTILLIIFSVSRLHAQQGQGQPSDNTPAAKLASHIADKMKDSLGLSSQQRAKVFQVNMDLYKQKMGARGKSKDRTTVGKDLQQIEKGRDDLYKPILSEQQYALYLQKKRNLITAQ
jgi:hypothetical protein